MPDHRQPQTRTGVLEILIDADACPVKDEVYKVAQRHDIKVNVISNSGMRVPNIPLITQVIVANKFDAADEHIAQHANALSVVITADILLADRCLKAGATVIAPTGKPFTDNSIGAALATRALMADLRAGGDVVGGPKPFTKADRSRFLSKLDETLVRLKRETL